jgi:diaminohydroxyphosphoribosylaminopyrimidine deaminase / 5-amino-6-(5-phosphoribosylamino)uracil reductase
MKLISIEEVFMKRALELASLGRGLVSPNPMVGCVIVHDGKVIGEGWHKKYGEAHAEVNAVNSVSDKSLLQYSDVYVTLEPCAHFGQTPPCADMLVNEKVKRIIVACQDPNPLVSGKGISKLQEANIDVTVGVLEKKARELNNRFFTFIQQRRPYIILKWAQTADGFIARENYDSKWISDEFSRKIVHQWRSEEDAILVGSRTALYDNPRLNVREWSGRNPVRVVIDRHLTLPQHLHLFDGSQVTLCYNLKKNEQAESVTYVQLPEENLLPSLLNDLHQRKIGSLIIEGGAVILQQFIEQNVWDEARVFSSPATFGKGIRAPQLSGKSFQRYKLQKDLLTIYFRND